jgi:DNA-binding NarL/FixJ family response regulator
MNIKIAIADDHPMIISGLQNILSNYSQITLTGTYSDGNELMLGLTQTEPDVLLLDIQLPGKTGDELAPIILKKYPTLRILALTNFDSVLYANNMIRNGVLGYLLKTAKQDMLIKAIETVYNGERFVEPVIEKQLGDFSIKMRSDLFAKVALTLREKEILQLVVNGFTNQQIVEKLFLSINTVKNYRNRIFIKLDVKNMAELTQKALKLGLVR